MPRASASWTTAGFPACNPDGGVKSVSPRRAVFWQKGTFTGTLGTGRNSRPPLFFVHFLLRKRKRTKRNRPRPGALRAALRVSQPAGPVELAYAQTATGPLSPAAAMLGPGRWDLKPRLQEAAGNWTYKELSKIGWAGLRFAGLGGEMFRSGALGLQRIKPGRKRAIWGSGISSRVPTTRAAKSGSTPLKIVSRGTLSATLLTT